MLIEGARGEYTDLRIPGIVATAGGALLRFCECRRAKSDWADIDISVSRSADGAQSWDEVLLIKSEGGTLNNPLAVATEDKIFFFYLKNYKELYVKVSTDDGITYSESRRIEVDSLVDFFYNAVAVGPGHGIYHRGRILIPMWFAYSRERDTDHHPSFIAILYSEDGGETWHIKRILEDAHLNDPSECALAPAADGRVLISIRHEGKEKCRAISVSPDGVSDWSTPVFEKSLPDPICMGGMTYSEGVVYHSNCASVSARENLVINATSDSFKTMRTFAVSDKGGYSDMAILRGSLYIFYERVSDRGNFELHLDKIDLNAIK
ncbi:MAG: exo-alpha-sialidase [Ruminococcaceae bacterium]|nr:exo-alpha-sialidase [Oscillospiraceae bacterium]